MDPNIDTLVAAYDQATRDYEAALEARSHAAHRRAVLVAAMVEAGWTQDALGDRLGITGARIGQLARDGRAAKGDR